jgi:hypothetical protein
MSRLDLLARGEAFDVDVHGAAPVEKGGDRARREERAARGHGTDGFHHLSRGLRLVDECASARLDRSEARSVAVLSGEEDELRLRPHLTDADASIGPGAVGEPEVDQDDVGLELLRALNRGDHRGRLADDSHVGLVVEQRREAVRHHLVVLDD